MERILESLKNNKNRRSTVKNYHQIWKQFNEFILKLDVKPNSWERRVALFCAYMVEKGSKSTTIHSYISALKNILVTDGYHWDESMILVESITKACRLMNDTVFNRFQTRIGFLEMILFEVGRIYKDNVYLEILYKTIFLISCYGLLCISEVAAEGKQFSSNHAVKACDVHIGQNEPKMLLVLYSSKTHGRESHPQEIKIKAVNENAYQKIKGKRHFCPFRLLRQYIQLRGSFVSEMEPLFTFQHNCPIQPMHIRKFLRTAIGRLGINASVYDFHSLRVGRTCDLIKMGYSVDEVKQMGWWKSNAVYHYICNV